MPSLGMYTIEGEVTRWLVPDGAAVEEGQPVLELTTEKAVAEVAAPASGVLHWVLREGALVKVQGLLGYVLAPGEAPPTLSDAQAEPRGRTGTGTSAPPPPRLRVLAPPGTRASGSQSPGGELRATPVARRRAAELGVDLMTVVGTGPGGRITEADIVAAAPGAGAAAVTLTTAPPPPVAPAERRVARRISLSGMRGLIARKMQHSLAAAAQLTLTREVDATPLVRAREALLARAAAEGLRVPYDALLAKALAAALLEQPALNAVIEGGEILLLADVHVGVAVALDARLVVPVLRDAGRRPALELARELAQLVERAREGRLRSQDMEGGTATLTNLGAYQVDAFTPILNPPESVMLGVGRIAPRPFVAEDGSLAVRPTVHLSLTFDHRVADGAVAATLLERVVAHWSALATEGG